MELYDYWKIIRKRIWIPILLVLLGGGYTFYTSLQQIPLYQTTTTLFLNPSAGGVLPYQVTRSVLSVANTYAEFMRTRSFATLVSEELEGTVPPGAIQGSLRTDYVQDTQFFRISAIHPDPAAAQAIANAAAKVLIDENLARQRSERAQVDAQRDPARVLERQRLAEMQSTLESELLYYDDQLKLIQGRIEDLGQEPPSADVDERILALRNDLVRFQGLRVDVLTTMAETQATLAASNETPVDVDTAVVVDAAPLPGGPLPSGTTGRLLRTILASLGLGLALTILLERLDYTIKTPEELDTVYGMPAQGVIGINTKGDRRDRGSELITVTDPLSPISEAFRALRTGIRVADLSTPLRSLLVTSAGPGEGKTFVTCNLALSIAQNGYRVILIDADLRKPQQHHMFDLPREPGFTNLVFDERLTLEDVLQDTPVENLKVITSGSIPPNPAELLGSERAQRIMDQIEGMADLVIYDSPPAATVTDAAVLAGRVGAVLQVVRAGHTRINLVLRCKAVLDQVGARVLGPVLNQVNVPDLGYYAYYYYHSYYGNGNGEGEKTQEPTRKLWSREKSASRESSAN